MTKSRQKRCMGNPHLAICAECARLARTPEDEEWPDELWVDWKSKKDSCISFVGVPKEAGHEA